MSQLDQLYNLDGQVALVTGAAGLLGSKFTEALTLAGAQVYALDIDAAQLQARRGAYNSELQSRVEPVAVDITDETAVSEAVDQIHTRTGVIDILVNSAAVDPKFDADALAKGVSPGAFATYSLQNWQRSLQVNLTGAFLMTRSVCRHMETRRQGVIVNISSTYGLVGPDQRLYESAEKNAPRFFKPVDYSVTKAGILGFTRALAAYYRGTGIRVNALSPGGTFNNNPDDFVERYSYRTIAGRMATPDDYTGAIIFLCSPASRYMTGANLIVDGGWTAL
jgi:NAD(P)-dependent dehydrogenase (short-subunit alcohol dehydrogenase family)